jgi:hypothetical protein
MFEANKYNHTPTPKQTNDMDTTNPIITALLRKTLATSTPDEVAFIYVPKERINKRILRTRFGAFEIDDDGATYCLTKDKLYVCFQKTETPTSSSSAPSMLGSWTLNIPPCAVRTMTSVSIDGNQVHSINDEVTARYIPERAAETVGKTVIHFFDAGEAEAFMRYME